VYLDLLKITPTLTASVQEHNQGPLTAIVRKSFRQEKQESSADCFCDFRFERLRMLTFNERPLLTRGATRKQQNYSANRGAEETRDQRLVSTRHGWLHLFTLLDAIRGFDYDAFGWKADK